MGRQIHHTRFQGRLRTSASTGPNAGRLPSLRGNGCVASPISQNRHKLVMQMDDNDSTNFTVYPLPTDAGSGVNPMRLANWRASVVPEVA